MKLKIIFKKQGGFNLLKNYWHTGALLPAFLIFIILGKSRKALEILRLVAQFKTNEKIKKMYSGKVDELLNVYSESPVCFENQPRRVYFCWFQGLENAPELVKKCYESIKTYITDREIILITEDNYKDYVKFPDYIEEKIEHGIISRTHMSDLLRLELLIRYGGTWIDATVLCTATPPSYMLDSDMFVFQLLKPGMDGHSLCFSNWFITAKPGALILRLTLDLLYEYWRDRDVLWDYYIFHHITEVIRAKCPEEWAKIIPFSNEVPHILLLRLFDEYSEKMWENIKQQTPFHKLSYKFMNSDFKKKNTYYAYIIGGDGDCRI